MRTMRVLGCTSTWISEPESGVNVIVLPEMALMAPICRAVSAARVRSLLHRSIEQ